MRRFKTPRLGAERVRPRVPSRMRGIAAPPREAAVAKVGFLPLAPRPPPPPAPRGVAEVRRKPQRDGPGRAVHTLLASHKGARAAGPGGDRDLRPRPRAPRLETRPAPPPHAPPPAARLGQSRAPRAEADGMGLRHCGPRPRHCGPRPLPAAVGVARGGPRRGEGAFHTRWAQRRSCTPRPPSGLGVRISPRRRLKGQARPLLPGVGDLTFRAPMGKFAVFAGPLERPGTQPCVDVEKYVYLMAQVAPFCPITSG